MILTRIVLFLLILASFLFSQVKIICIGDSNTGSPGHYDESQYPAILQNLLGSDYLVENYGLAGSTLSSKGGNSYIQSWLYDAAKFTSPDIIIIILGTNDTDPNHWAAYGHLFEEDYINFIYGLREEANPLFLLGYPPPLFNNPNANKIITDEIIPIIDSVADATGAKTANFHDPLNDESYFPDGTHINTDGFKVMATVAYNRVIALLDQTPPGVPTGLTAIAKEASIILSWNTVNDHDIASYVLFSGLTPGELAYKSVIIHPSTTYTDSSLIQGQSYYYSIAAMDKNGNMSAQSTSVQTALVQDEEEHEEDDNDDDPENNPDLPIGFSLMQNYPNPFNPYTKIQLYSPDDAFIEISIYNSIGMKVRKLLSKNVPAGFNAVTWDGRDDHGYALGTGIYFYQLVSGGYSKTLKMALIR
jgi:lysophospholipase L1-like esterase